MMKVFTGGSRTAATSKMEHFVIIGWKPLAIITKCSIPILDVVEVVDPPLNFCKNSEQLFTMNFLRKNTAQKTKFYIKDSSVNVTKSAVPYGFGHIY